MTETLTISAAPLPDWATIDDEILCPLCDYNLRGLPEPRCPECGYRFDWPDLLDPTRRKHPFVFEHHPERNAWSFYRTVLAGLRPTRFWRKLHPAQPASVGRLVKYVLIVATFMIAGSLVHVISTAAMMSKNNQLYRMQIRRSIRGSSLRSQQLKAHFLSKFDSVDAWLDQMAPPVFSLPFAKNLVQGLGTEHSAAVVNGMYLTWPVLSLAALLIFRWSMRRAKVRTIHVFRCIAYAFDATVWVTVGFLCAAVAWFAWRVGFNIRQELFILHLSFVVLAIALMTYRLYVGYKVYLQFDHPLATAVASQIIVLLTAINIVLFVTFGS